MELKIQSRKLRHNIIKRILVNLRRISAQKVLYAALVFFISLSKLPFGSLPLGCAVFAAEYVSGVPVFYGILVLLAGFLGGFSVASLIELAFVMLIFSAADMKFNLKRSPLLKSIATSLASLFCILIPKLFTTLYLYDTILIFAEAGSVFLLSLAFQKAKEECSCNFGTLFGKASLCAFAAFSLLGAASFSFGYVNLGLLISAILLIIFSYENGVPAAMIAGMTAGFSLGCALGDMPYFIMLFTLSALLSGAFAPLGKSVSAMGYVLSASFCAFYSPSTLQGFVALSVFSLSALLFTVTPKKLTAPFSLFKQGAKSFQKIYKDYNIAELFESGYFVDDISKSFETLSKTSSDGASVSFFERATARLCGDCAMQQNCWRGEFHRTYTSFFVLTQLCEKKGNITYRDIPASLSGKCLKAGSVSSVFNSLYDVYKVDRLWEGKMSENREALGILLRNISKSIDEKAEKMAKRIRFLPLLMTALEKAFLKENIETEKIFVYSISGKETFADITFEDMADVSKTEEICRRTLGGNYKCVYSRENFIKLSLFPDVNFETTIIQKPKQEAMPNGDSALSAFIPASSYALVLSDGMGYGKAASSYSKSVTALSKNLLQSGISPENTAEILNGTLLLKSTEIAFSSIDMAILNASSMTAQFYKMGAAPSFIKSGSSVKTILSATLPAGSFTKSDISVIDYPLSKGDIIIMVSDGVANTKNTTELENLISSSGGSCAEIADMLISYCNKNGADDDVTVMVTCIN